MNANRTTMSAIVAAAFTMRVGREPLVDIISNLSEQDVPFEYGLFPEQDQRVVASIMYSTLSEAIANTYYDPKALQDRPRNGSREANDSGRPDENKEEMAIQQDDAFYRLAAGERHSLSLYRRSLAVLEEAGKKTGDGSRVKYILKNSTWVMPNLRVERMLLDTIANATPESNWLYKAQQCLDDLRDSRHFTDTYVGEDGEVEDGGVYSAMSETDAEAVMADLVEQVDNITRVVDKACTRVVDLLAECGLEIQRHEEVMERLNEDLQIINEAYPRMAERKLKSSSVMTQMSAETMIYNSNIKFLQRKLDKALEPSALLANGGKLYFEQIVASPEWQTKVAERSAAQMRAETSRIQAMSVQMSANFGLMEAQANMAKIQALVAKQQEELEAKMKEIQAMMKPAKVEKPAKAEKSAKAPKAEKPAKSESASEYKGTNILSSRGSILQPTFRRGM